MNDREARVLGDLGEGGPGAEARRAAPDEAATVGAATGGHERTVVHLLRHGQVHNPEGILYGRLPGYRLSARGREQARTVAEALARHDIVRVVASPLERAQETAAPLADGHRLPVHIDDRLIEAGNFFEGRRVALGNGVLAEPAQWWKLRNPFTPSWGEAYTGIARRMWAAAYAARAAAAGGEAVCVSHQLPIWTLRRSLERRRLWHDPRHRQCALASVTSLVFTGEVLSEIVYSEPAVAHPGRV